MRRIKEQKDGTGRLESRCSPAAGVLASTHSLGVVARGETYTLADFKRRTGLGDNSLRQARRAGFRIIYAHGKAFVTGDDWHAYLESLAPAEERSQ